MVNLNKSPYISLYLQKMSRAEQMLAEARRLEQLRANELQRALSNKLGEIDEAERARLKAALEKVINEHIATLEYGLTSGLISETEYRERMSMFVDEIDLGDLLSPLG